MFSFLGVLSCNTVSKKHKRIKNKIKAEESKLVKDLDLILLVWLDTQVLNKPKPFRRAMM